MSNGHRKATGGASSEVQQTVLFLPPCPAVAIPEPQMLPQYCDVVTPAPVRSLHDELYSIRPLGTQFSSISEAFQVSLAADRNADDVREKMRVLQRHLRAALIDISDAFAQARVYYSHRESESSPEEEEEEGQEGEGECRVAPSIVATARLMRNLTKREFRERMCEHAQAAAASLESAIETLEREVVPRIARVQQKIQSYVEGYMKRCHVREQRDRSWVQAIFVGLFSWGGLDGQSLLRWDMAKVEALSSKWTSVGVLIRILVGFIQHMHLHMMHLVEVAQRSLPSLGITTKRDLRRLYSDRVVCRGILMTMDDMFLAMEEEMLSNIG